VVPFGVVVSDGIEPPGFDEGVGAVEGSVGGTCPRGVVEPGMVDEGLDGLDWEPGAVVCCARSVPGVIKARSIRLVANFCVQFIIMGPLLRAKVLGKLDEDECVGMA
jgi:hypothetical protein